MKTIYLFVLACFFLSGLSAQELNYELKAELDSIMTIDQGTRQLMDPNTDPETRAKILNKLGYTQSEYDADPWGITLKHDSLNQKRVYEILDHYGYPGKTLVGTPTHMAAWLVIQHSDAIAKYLPIIKEAGKEGEIAATDVAMMEDRYLMHQGKEQIYGTQAWGAPLKNRPDRKEEMVFIIWPIKDPHLVNERRKEVGFTTTVEEYAQAMNIEYENYSLEEAKHMLKRTPGEH
ncbi:hypothetical protein E7Z59_01235 [Robertkochia marina]|uniref:GLPGLI family protein n=1 Tax=Robertkochia marina TaxID=1227945 RepID=A0A4S3M1M1_9FLAO|nr:DUF6624 domain-containing protein [Robertkochia marina]THD68982.1 hypothetical protein E7Z59_01235 [Robertkochia marina]TRZ44804.1 hypothetical protein D3A96_07195 [Robertkochia marina]